jgi:hypothetical protein
LLALSADLVAIAGVVKRLQKRLGRPRNGDPVTTARYHIAALTVAKSNQLTASDDSQIIRL